MLTLQNAAFLLSLAALGGLTMLVIRLRGAPYPPLWLALGHGFIAVCGVAILGSLYLQSGLPEPANWALLCFVLAALGGLTLFFGFHMPARALPVPIILAHGAIAATGLYLLLRAVFV
jgi:hypothetical protein